jgi:predicted RNA-binding protein YlxR (DUF448 family)
MGRRGIRRQPERTCVGCRSTAPKEELVRVVRLPGGAVAVDETACAAGRGAYVHRAEACLDHAAKSGALERALKVGLAPAQAVSLMTELRMKIGESA